ncbi:MAG: formate/nitrite transporter family protein [Oscillospiraceae bacterium]|nr:formate/nitrite transporter family protein [Oscillospiraceae bacterium]
MGGVVYLSCDNKYLGAMLFGLGLYTIIQFGFYLFTGKVGYIVNKGVKYIPEVLLILFGNFIGTFVTAFLVNQTRFGNAISEKAYNIMEGKLADSPLSAFILAIFCGMLMYIAVENASISRKTNSDVSIIAGTLLAIMVFILSGFNHCIADMFYLFVSGNYKTEAIVYFICVILGNSVGGMTLPVIRKLGGLNNNANKEQVK